MGRDPAARKISHSKASDFCDETKDTKSSFRGAAPKDPFVLENNRMSVFLVPLTCFVRGVLRVADA